MSERYLNFFTDYGFKRLFGSEPTKDCLIDFLNSLFEGKEAPIVHLEHRNATSCGQPNGIAGPFLTFTAPLKTAVSHRRTAKSQDGTYHRWCF